MAKKLKGKQKQEDKANPANVASFEPTTTDAHGTTANQPQHVVLTAEEPQRAAWGTGWGQETGGGGAEGAWGTGADNAEVAWGGNAEKVGETWGVAGGNLPQPGSDDSSLGQSEILQPPPGVLATVPEHTPSTPYHQNRRPLSDIGEINNEYDSDWENQPDYNRQSHDLTDAPSSMGSPRLQPTVSLAEAAAAAQKELQKQGKTTTASEAARRMEESRRHSVQDPQQLAAQQEAFRTAPTVYQAADKKKSSASAAAAAMQASHLKHRSTKQAEPAQSQSAPGKMTWTDLKPFMEGGRDPAHIPPDPSWIHTGGNAWSRKHLAAKSVSAVNWAQPIETPWPPAHNIPPHSQRSSHKKHHSHVGHSHPSHRPSASQQHQSWHSWGKGRWAESPDTQTDSDDDVDAVNIVDSRGTYNYNSRHADQIKDRDKRSRRRQDEGGDHWGEQGQQGNTGWGEQGGRQDNGWGGGGGANQWNGPPKSEQVDHGWGQDHGGSGWEQDKPGSGRVQDNGGSGWGQENHHSGREQNGSQWGQDKGNGGNDSNWGKDKGSGWSDAGGQKQGGFGWGEQQAGDSWGTANNNTGSNWGQVGNSDWGRKVPATADAGGGTRNAVSPQQISQIYNSFLSGGQGHNSKSQGQEYGKASKHDTQDTWEVESGWGSESDGETTPRRVRFSPKASELWGGSPRSVPSKAMAAALQQGLTTTMINDPSIARFVESRGAGLAFVSNAFFGNARLSKERIYWLFPQDKDQRISGLMAWVQKMSFNLGTYGLMKFLENRERGGLFVNAAFRMREHPQEPAFDFLTFDQLQGTMDKTLQESVAFYDPARFAMAFVFLPSQSGNSIAIWRRKINVPDAARQKYRAQIEATVKTLRKPDEYTVMVDELPKKAKVATTTRKPGQLRKPAKKANTKAANDLKQNPNTSKKARKWWKLFLS